MKGKFITIYGINNIGKSTQVKKLVDYLNDKGIKAEYLKYPVYEQKPSGPMINSILRSEKQLVSEEELQMWYALNRFQYEPILKQKLDAGIWVIAEDYTGTGIAWGYTKGASLEWLETINEYLIKEDSAILMDGERFLAAKEATHVHESNDELMRRNREVQLMLAKRYGWPVVNANQGICEVFACLLEELELEELRN